MDPLEEGLASRVYIAAFPCFRSTYEIAKMVVPGSSAVNSSGRILKLTEKFPTHFKIKTEQVTKHKTRTLIMSEVQPFLSKLSEACQLSPEEVKVINAFEPNFRNVMGIYLELTLKRDPRYLALSLKAFEELSNALCLTLYMARVCSYAPQQASTFSISMLSITLPGILGVGGVSNAKWVNLAKNLTKIASQQTIIRLYTKVRKIVSPTYEMAFTMLEGFEKYYKEFEKHVTKRT
jgi:hypothetical protein